MWGRRVEEGRGKKSKDAGGKGKMKGRKGRSKGRFRWEVRTE